MVKGQYWVIEMIDAYTGKFAYSQRNLDGARAMAKNRKEMHPEKSYIVVKDVGMK